MQLIFDLSQYLEKLDELSKTKTGVKLLEQSLIEITFLYEIADLAFSSASTNDPELKKEIVNRLNQAVTEYFSRLNNS